MSTMSPKSALISLLFIHTLFSCNPKESTSPLVGTWELVSATTTEKDTTFSTFDATHKMIKMLNATHFAFLNHAVDRTKDSSATAFSAGGGRYTLADSTYTEHLEYFTDKAWENHDFPFTIALSGDTLMQRGVEKIEKLGIDRVIVEKYIRVKK